MSSPLSKLEKTEVYVARRTGITQDRTPSYGTRQKIKMHRDENFSVGEDGTAEGTKLTVSTGKWEFESTDGVWFPDKNDDETDPSDARQISDTGATKVMNYGVSYAVL